jgi:nitrite reductase/ring-hydroxylating ferredoxin subunit
MNDHTQFVKLAAVEDFDSIRMKSFSILAKPIAIIKDPDGTFWATEIGCKHNNFDLTNGRFNGDEVRCPRHGWVYNIRDGQCLNHSSAPLRRHALEVRGDDLYVSMFPDHDPDEIDDDDWNIEIKMNK